MSKSTFNIIANGVWGPEGLSGGDNIFINFGKNLRKLGYEINVYTWEDGFELCQNHGFKKANFVLWKARRWKFLGFSGLYLIRTIKGCLEALKIKKTNGTVIVYAASDFWPDSLPAFLMSRRLKCPWIAGFYLFAPNPLSSVRNFFFWFTQKPIFWLISKCADLICVTSEPDIKPFIRAGRKASDLFIVKGGIDYQHLKQFQNFGEKIYDAVFVGRFHPQKGVLEMIDMWKIVTNKMPDTKLAVIGVGPLENKMKEKVGKYNLTKNIDFLGPLIGEAKNKILQRSKIFLHPVIYDSGGMAPADGLACGLPGVSFDLPVFKSYYPKGFLHAKIGDISDFADKIICLLGNQGLYQNLSREAVEEAKNWDWEKKTAQFVEQLSRLNFQNGKK